MFNKNISLLLIFILQHGVIAGPFSYGLCQTGCNALAVACYGAAGLTFGTITAGVGAPAAALACNVALGTCMAGCVAAGFSPIP